MRLSMFAALLASSLVSVSAFDEVGILQLASFDNATSTGKNCVPKGVDPTGPHERYFALVRSGDSAVVSSYQGHYNGSALTAVLNDKNMSLTVSQGTGGIIRVSVQQEDGVCEYTTTVVAGSVLSVNSSTNTPITEAGVLTVADLKNMTNAAICEAVAEEINGTYAFVRTDNLTVMGGLWTHKANTTLKRKAGDELQFEVTAKDGAVAIHTDGGKNATVRDAGGCTFSAVVANGSVMGVLAANSTAAVPGLRGANKVVCRQTCGPRVCRTVCRDYWRQ